MFEIWHRSLDKGPLRRDHGLPVSVPAERSSHTNHLLSRGKEEGFDGKESILLFWKAHNGAANLQ